MLHENPTIHPTAQVIQSTLGYYTEVGQDTELHHVRLGQYSYVCERCHLMYAHIESFVSIAQHVRINPSNHPTWRASQHHFSYRASRYGFGEDDHDFFAWRKEHSVHIGHDVWIGHGAQILPGVNVGTGAVIGAGAIVTKDVPPYAIMVGVPAKIVKYRFPEHIQTRLLSLAWWHWNHNKIKESLGDFQTLPIEAFLEKHESTLTSLLRHKNTQQM